MTLDDTVEFYLVLGLKLTAQEKHDSWRSRERCSCVPVFDRGDGFDPRQDTIVRVEGRRLRTKLREYYDGSPLLLWVAVDPHFVNLRDNRTSP